MKISIITPVYNGVKTIERTIKSVIEQNYNDFEYIVVDGMSTDGTAEIIKRYLRFISCYIREKDDGIYDAINKGINVSTGEIIGIINSDDWYEANCIHDVEKCFVNEKADIVYGDFNVIGEYGLEKKKAGELKGICLGMTIPHPTMFVKKAIYDHIGGYDTEYRISSDYDFALRCYMDGVRFEHIPKVLANFSLGGVSTTNVELCKKETQDIFKKYVNESLLNNCFSEMLDKELVVHGAGFWGKWLVEKLVKLYTKDIIWVDKNCRKEVEESEFGLKIQHPSKEKDSDRQIIVAIYEGDAIENEYLSRGKRVISIKKVLDRYMDIVYTSRNIK